MKAKHPIYLLSFRNNLSSTDIGSLALGSVSLGDDDDDLTAAIKSASFVMLPNLEFSEVEAALQVCAGQQLDYTLLAEYRISVKKCFCRQTT